MKDHELISQINSINYVTLLDLIEKKRSKSHESQKLYVLRDEKNAYELNGEILVKDFYKELSHADIMEFHNQEFEEDFAVWFTPVSFRECVFEHRNPYFVIEYFFLGVQDKINVCGAFEVQVTICYEDNYFECSMIEKYLTRGGDCGLDVRL